MSVLFPFLVSKQIPPKITKERSCDIQVLPEEKRALFCKHALLSVHVSVMCLCACIYTRVWKPEVDFRSLLLSPHPLSFVPTYLTEPRAHWLARLTAQQDVALCLCNPLPVCQSTWLFNMHAREPELRSSFLHTRHFPTSLDPQVGILYDLNPPGNAERRGLILSSRTETSRDLLLTSLPVSLSRGGHHAGLPSSLFIPF